MLKTRRATNKDSRKPSSAETVLMIPMAVDMSGLFFPGIMVADEPPSTDTFGLGKIGKPFMKRDGAMREAKDDIAAALRYGERLGDKKTIPVYLLRRGYMPVEPQKGTRKRGLKSEQELLSRTCAWCGGIVFGDQHVYGTGVSIGTRARKGFKPFFGSRILLPLSTLGRSLPVAVAQPGSGTRRRGHDVTFMTCSSNCSTQLKRALEREKDALGDAVFV